MKLSDKISILMLCDIYEALNLNNIDAALVREAVQHGYEDFIKWEYPQFELVSEEQKQKNHDIIDKVMDILGMWRLIEDSIHQLPEEEQQSIKQSPHEYQFRGFDGNHESEYGYAVRFILRHLHRFTEFIDRDLNTHAPRIDKYNRMLGIKNQILNDNIPRSLTIDEILEILRA